MIDYFEIYKLVLDVVHDERPSDGQEVIKYLSEKYDKHLFHDHITIPELHDSLDCNAGSNQQRQ